MKLSLLLFAIFSLISNCSVQNKISEDTKDAQFETNQVQKITKRQVPDGYAAAYFASGCFWCVEAVYESVKGVKEAVSGYAEGTEKTAKYSLVSAGTTDHVEAIEVIYDPKVVSYEDLLVVFFGSGDPTTLNQQGPDRGYQYRSAIYYQNDEEKLLAEKIKKELDASKVWKNPIVTDITAYTTFFDAEEYHQDFEAKNPNQGYVRAVSVPRLNRFKKAFPDLLKSDNH